MEASARVERVTPLELFFDLVFVFAITQVTTLLSRDPTWGGLLRGLVVLAALWWAWAAYAWLTNTLNPEEGLVRIAMFVVMGAMLVCALAVPEAFGDHGVIFGVAYLVVRAMHIALYALAARGDPDLLGAVLRMTALVDDQRLPDPRRRLPRGQGANDVVDPRAGDRLPRRARRPGPGWRLSPGHFVERHGLVVIIAIGESIVALGVSASGTPLTAGVITTALVGMTIATALWWTYFDWVAIVLEHRLREATGTAQTTLARDAFSYLHFVIVAGIVLFAMSLKKALAHYDAHLAAVPATALCAGLGAYLLAHVLLRYRISGTIGHGRPVAFVGADRASGRSPTTCLRSRRCRSPRRSSSS